MARARQLALAEIGAPQPKGEVARAVREAKRAKNERFELMLAQHIAALGLPAPQRQYYFAESIGRKFKADFAWPERSYRFLIEVQGGIWRRGGGAHSHPTNIERDIERQRVATLLGWFLVPVTTDEVKKGVAIAELEHLFASRGWRR